MNEAPHNRCIRVFPRRTKATPTDALAFIGDPPLELPDGVSEIRVSCVFTWDLPRASGLAQSWSRFGIPVNVGGPAYDKPGGDFEPGLYLRKGYTITSRGCPNHCWFCSVPAREGGLRELPICDGWNILDDNLLACSERHVRGVFEMLKRQPQPADFSGGLEANLLRPWHVDLLSGITVKQVWFAYDTPDDYGPLCRAGAMLREIGITAQGAHKARAYVLIGAPDDTPEKADSRLRQTIAAGFLPHAMLWRDEAGHLPAIAWRRFQRLWARPAIIAARLLPTTRRRLGEAQPPLFAAGSAQAEGQEKLQRPLLAPDDHRDPGDGDADLAQAGELVGGHAQGGE